MGKQNSLKIYIQNNTPNRTGSFLEAWCLLRTQLPNMQ
jgi:hypothetical protein